MQKAFFFEKILVDLTTLPPYTVERIMIGATVSNANVSCHPAANEIPTPITQFVIMNANIPIDSPIPLRIRWRFLTQKMIHENEKLSM